MHTHDLIQGTPAWLAHRSHYLNASDAAAMMGESTYQSRTELLHALKTGLRPEVSPFMQTILDEGHRCEALARQHLAENIVGEALYPCIGTRENKGASFDGLTMDERVCFEHKLLNALLRACKTIDDVPLMYKIQMQQQMWVAQAQRCLFIASAWDEHDQLEDKVVFWYEYDDALAQRILDGWVQLLLDLESYVPAALVVVPVTQEIMALPALSFDIRGEVKASNLAVYQTAAMDFVNGICTDLQTDDDFAQAEKTVKFCKAAEDKLSLKKEQALANTASIDELLRTLDHIASSLRSKRLILERLLKTQKDHLKAQHILNAQQALTAHVAELNAELDGVSLPSLNPRFAEVIKGKKSLASLESALADELARLKIEADRMARVMRGNLAHLAQYDGAAACCPDLQNIICKSSEDFMALVAARIQHRDTVQATLKVSTRSTDNVDAPRRMSPEPQADAATSHAKPPLNWTQRLLTQLRQLIVFAHSQGYANDTAELEYMVGGL